MADQFRGDALGCAGDACAKTPNLDRIAAEGARFSRAYSSTPSCTPARAALLTGRSPWGHGMLGYHRIAEQYPVELPRLLTAAGYRTHAIGKNHFDPQRATHGYQSVELDESGRVESEGFVSDYRRWFAEQAPELDPDATKIGWNDYRARAYALPERLHPTRWTGDRAVEFLEDRNASDATAPFFLKVSFARPHSPYDPPARLLEAHAGCEPRAAAEGAWSESEFGGIERPQAYRAARNNLGVETVAASRRAYNASISFIDEEIGRILKALEDAGELENTLVLFTSDHGDMLGDHHLWRKALPYEGSVRIPLLMRWGANVSNAAPAQVRDELVELRDVLPTVLDALGQDKPPGTEGASLLGLVRGDGAPWRASLDLEHATTYWPENVWTALVGERWKYVYFARDGREQLFDLANDPTESQNLAQEPGRGAELEHWRARMIEHLRPRGAPWVVGVGLEARLGQRRETILTGANYPRETP